MVLENMSTEILKISNSSFLFLRSHHIIFNYHKSNISKYKHVNPVDGVRHVYLHIGTTINERTYFLQSTLNPLWQFRFRFNTRFDLSLLVPINSFHLSKNHNLYIYILVLCFQKWNFDLLNRKRQSCFFHAHDKRPTREEKGSMTNYEQHWATLSDDWRTNTVGVLWINGHTVYTNIQASSDWHLNAWDSLNGYKKRPNDPP